MYLYIAQKMDSVCFRFRGWYDVRSQKGPHYVLISQFLANTPKSQLFKKMTKLSDAQIKKLHSQFLYRKTKSGNIDQRPLTAPSVMSMKEYQSSVKGDHSEHVKIGEVTQIFVPNEEEQESESESVEESKQGRETTCTTYDERTESFTDSGFKSMSYGTNSSPLSMRLKQLSLKAEDKDDEHQTNNCERPSSAFAFRENLNEDGNCEANSARKTVKQRAKSAPGERTPRGPEDIAPVPYMEHSKPVTVRVGSIGKVSLLESITEARFWENFIQDSIDRKLPAEKLQHPSVDKGETSEIEGMDGTKDLFNEKTGESTEDNFISNITGYENIKSPNRQKKKATAKGSDATEMDMIAQLLEEEKKRRRVKKPGGRPSLSVSTKKPWQQQQNRPVTTSYKSRQSLQPSVASKDSGNATESSAPGSRSISRSTGQSTCTIRGKRPASSGSQSKYQGIVERLGDNMTPYMKQLMLHSVNSA